MALRDSLNNQTLFADINRDTTTVDSVLVPAGGAEWTFAWDGLYTGDSLAAYRLGDTADTLQALSLQNAVIVDTLSERWVRVENNNEGIRYQDKGLDTEEVSDSVGTAKIVLLCKGSHTSGFAVCVWEATNSDLPGDNRIYPSITSSGTVRMVHEGDNNSQNFTTSNSISVDTETTIYVSWDVGRDSLAVKVGANAWEVSSENIEEFGVSNQLNATAIGEIGAGSSDDAKIYIRDLKIWQEWKKTE
jgi:hypothetical protein